MPVVDLKEAGFEVQKIIGTAFGGAGSVFSARSEKNGRVACKVFAIDLLANPHYKFSHIVDEVHILKWLRHQNIVTLNGACVLGRHLCISMPLSDMGSALYVMDHYYTTGIPEKAIALILKQLLHAVDYVHKQNIIHRALRASHILLDSTGGVRLSGFRHSLLFDSILGTQRICKEFTDHLVDSLLWLAPEVLAQDMAGYGASSDVYSIGICLCEMGNGFPPFSDMESLQMLFEKQRGTTPRLLDETTMFDDDQSEHRQRRFSDDFHHITDLCLQALPDNRPTIAELLEHPFVRKVKKCNLYALLPNARTIGDFKDKALMTTPPSDTHLESAWDFTDL